MQIDLAQLCRALVFLMSCCAMAWNFCPAVHTCLQLHLGDSKMGRSTERGHLSSNI